MTRRPFGLALALAPLLLACSGGETPIEPKAPVVALLLSRDDGTSCHAVCVGRGVALTAAHCLDGSRQEVVREGGARAIVRGHRVGRGGLGHARGRGAGLRDDLAALDVGEICDRAPTAASVGVGATVHLQRRVERDAPKEAVVRARGSGLVITTPVVCAGDSGAPLVDARGRLVGVAVARTFEGCATGGSVFVDLEGLTVDLARL